MVSVAPPRSGEEKVYVPLSSGPSSSVTRPPELLSLILGLSGETVYPLDTGGAKFGMLCGLRSVKLQRTYVHKNIPSTLTQIVSVAPP